ncbi:MAG TPA: DUF1778 domain-containing protein [Candidatus Dormibacteraeota bacterium]|nr:DUF1778 domain-containing protein [Candidatus Dormibacteraeota bacterium]
MNLRATERQLELLRAAAGAQGRSLTDLVLSAAAERAEEVLVERRHFVASPEAWDYFMRTLENPPAPNQPLIDLLRDADR